RLSELDEHSSEFFAGATKMLGAGLITGFVRDEFILDEADAVTREYSQNFTVAFSLRNHGAITLSAALVLATGNAQIVRKLHADPGLCAVAVVENFGSAS